VLDWSLRAFPYVLGFLVVVVLGGLWLGRRHARLLACAELAEAFGQTDWIVAGPWYRAELLHPRAGLRVHFRARGRYAPPALIATGQLGGPEWLDAVPRYGPETEGFLTGDAPYDAAFVVQSSSLASARAFISPEIRRLQLETKTSLSVSHGDLLLRRVSNGLNARDWVSMARLGLAAREAAQQSYPCRPSARYS
jgi:hypothetical protein